MAIDQGTSSSRAVIFDLSGRILGVAHISADDAGAETQNTISSSRTVGRNTPPPNKFLFLYAVPTAICNSFSV